MDCEKKFCIYQRNNKCTLDQIELDINGNCTECILVNIEDKLLTELKDKQLDNIEHRAN